MTTAELITSIRRHERYQALGLISENNNSNDSDNDGDDEDDSDNE